MTLSQDVAPTAYRGAFLGVFRLVSDTGVLLGALVPGAVADAASLTTSCVLMTAMAAGTVAQLGLLVRETLVREDAPAGRKAGL